jgi:hypothetical protein
MVTLPLPVLPLPRSVVDSALETAQDEPPPPPVPLMFSASPPAPPPPPK